MKQKKLNITAVIPARYNSRRFPGKVLYPICGTSLVQRVYENVRKSSLLDRVIVATEDKRVYNAVSRFGGEAVLTSPDHVSGTDRIWEAVENEDTDIVVNIQGDEPLLHAKAVDALCSPFTGGSDVLMSTLVFESTNTEQFFDVNTVKVVINSQSDALYFSRSGIPYNRDGIKGITWYKHIGVYAYTKDFLKWIAQTAPGKLERIEKLEQLRVLEYGYAIKVVLYDTDSVGIDIPQDIEKVEKILQNNS